MLRRAGLKSECNPITIGQMQTDIRRFEAILAGLQARGEHHPTQLQIESVRIRAGLEARSIERITARFRNQAGRCKRASFVAKQLQGAGNREALVYEALLRKQAVSMSPAVYFVDRSQRAQVWLLLEDVRPVSRWPWRDIDASAAVLRSLAELHSAQLMIPSRLEWDYESELQRSSIATVEVLEAMRLYPEWSSLIKRGCRPLQRIAVSLARRREALLDFFPSGPVTIHGDVHTGNVILRRTRGRDVPVLIDWARTRAGSALEDVSSWLQSLGFWEPEARKKHDTLLCEYLYALGSRPSLSNDLRAAYWMAGASNALAGALRYHCLRACTATTVRARADATLAVASWLRIIIRADALSS